MNEGNSAVARLLFSCYANSPGPNKFGDLLSSVLNYNFHPFPNVQKIVSNIAIRLILQGARTSREGESSASPLMNCCRKGLSEVALHLLRQPKVSSASEQACV